MKTLLAIAVLASFGSIAAASANAQDSADWGVRSAQAQVADASARVRMAFSVRRDAAAPQKVVLRSETPVATPAANIVPVSTGPDAAPVASTTPWYGRDRSLQRGDIVVTDQGALVYEGERGGKRHFRSLQQSRLVSAEEREKIVVDARR